jgi:hypothetical protein
MEKNIRVPYLVAILLLLNFYCLNGQKTSGQWDSYLAYYEQGNIGATTLRMDLVGQAPIEKLPYALVAAISYKTSRKDGLPESETLKALYQTGSDLKAFISKETETVLAGTFMYANERLLYFYVQDFNGLDQKIAASLAKKYPDLEYYLTIKEDKQWLYYRDFLYPNEQTLNQMAAKAQQKTYK